MYKIARKFRLRDQGGWAAWIHAVFTSPGGVGHRGVVFRYEPCTPDSRGIGHGGVVFSYELRTPDSRGGLAMEGSFSATNCVLPIPEGGWPWRGRFQLRTAYSRFQRGVGHGGVVFSYELRTPDSRGGLAMEGSFSATNCVLPIPVGGLAMEGSFSATNHVLPIPAGKARPTGLDFMGVAPEWVYTFSRRRRGRLAGPGNIGPGPAGQAVLRSPEGPF